MDSFAAVIDAFGGNEGFSEKTGIVPSHVRAMRSRSSIAPLYWPRIIDAASNHGVSGITHELLTTLYCERWGQPPRAHGADAKQNARRPTSRNGGGV